MKRHGGQAETRLHSLLDDVLSTYIRGLHCVEILTTLHEADSVLHSGSVSK